LLRRTGGDIFEQRAERLDLDKDIKIIYFRRRSAYSAPNGDGTVSFLVKHFTFLGFDAQYWMLIVVGLIAAFVLYVWKTRERN
jgi:hypothetical protein